jgi:hypothetical protein
MAPSPKLLFSHIVKLAAHRAQECGQSTVGRIGGNIVAGAFSLRCLRLHPLLKFELTASQAL